MIERGKSADQLEKGKVNKRLAHAIAQDKGNSHGQGYQTGVKAIAEGKENSSGQRHWREKALTTLNFNIAFALEGYVQP